MGEGKNLNKQPSIKLNRITVPLKSTHMFNASRCKNQNEGNEMPNRQSFRFLIPRSARRVCVH